MKENIIVAVRAKPLAPDEPPTGWRVDEGSNTVTYEPTLADDGFDSLSVESPLPSAAAVKSSRDRNTPPPPSAAKKPASPAAASTPSSSSSSRGLFGLSSKKSPKPASPAPPAPGKAVMPFNLSPNPASFLTPSKQPDVKSTPPGKTPTKGPPAPAATPLSATVLAREAARAREFVFDHAFGPVTSTGDIFESLARPLVVAAMEGMNATIFAYGQTSSGKTFTMMGEGKKHDRKGIIPLAIDDIFEMIQNVYVDREFLLRVSYLEIYNEVINDLLAPENVNLKIHEDSKKKGIGGLYVGGLKEQVVGSADQVMKLIAAGEAYRHIGATDYNEQSSRSHTIFRMVIESKQGDSDGGPASRAVRVSVLNLIDLAGSERVSTEAAMENLRRKEGSYINKSLLTLGHVISKLSELKDDSEATHIPYRDSKLTRILQPSLSGKAKIAIICTISLSPDNFEESNSTLKFASRAKKIKHNAKVNEIVDDKALIQRYQKEIADLKRKLAEAEEAEQKLEELNSIKRQKEKIEEDAEQLKTKLMEQQALTIELQGKLRNLTKLILKAHSDGQSSGGGLVVSSGPGSSGALSASGTANVPSTPRGGSAEPSTPRSGAAAADSASADRSTPATPRQRSTSITSKNGYGVEGVDYLSIEEAKKLQQTIKMYIRENLALKESMTNRQRRIEYLEATVDMLRSQLEEAKAAVRDKEATPATVPESAAGTPSVQPPPTAADGVALPAASAAAEPAVAPGRRSSTQSLSVTVPAGVGSAAGAGSTRSPRSPSRPGSFLPAAGSDSDSRLNHAVSRELSERIATLEMSLVEKDIEFQQSSENLKRAQKDLEKKDQALADWAATAHRLEKSLKLLEEENRSLRERPARLSTSSPAAEALPLEDLETY